MYDTPGQTRLTMRYRGFDCGTCGTRDSGRRRTGAKASPIRRLAASGRGSRPPRLRLLRLRPAGPPHGGRLTGIRGRAEGRCRDAQDAHAAGAALERVASTNCHRPDGGRPWWCKRRRPLHSHTRADIGRWQRRDALCCSTGSDTRLTDDARILTHAAGTRVPGRLREIRRSACLAASLRPAGIG